MDDKKTDVLDSLVSRFRRTGLRPGSPLLFIIICALVILFWLIWASTSSFWAWWAGAANTGEHGVPVKTATAGAWGDSFGGFNALAGALGFGAVAITLNLQYRSLERQKVDQHVSRFEENFFRLIDLMRSLRDNLKYVQTSKFMRTGSMYASPSERRGYGAIEAAYHEVNYWSFKKHVGHNKIKRSILAGEYDNYVHARYESCFAPYFRMIYTILYNIKHDPVLSQEQKEFYGNILRSQLTSFEIGLLAFNATSEVAKDLDELIAYFRLLKYLPRKRRKILGNIYPKVAYQARS